MKTMPIVGLEASSAGRRNRCANLRSQPALVKSRSHQNQFSEVLRADLPVRRHRSAHARLIVRKAKNRKALRCERFLAHRETPPFDLRAHHARRPRRRTESSNASVRTAEARGCDAATISRWSAEIHGGQSLRERSQRAEFPEVRVVQVHRSKRSAKQRRIGCRPQRESK